jgi:hypothetical protein
MYLALRWEISMIVLNLPTEMQLYSHARNHTGYISTNPIQQNAINHAQQKECNYNYSPVNPNKACSSPFDRCSPSCVLVVPSDSSSVGNFFNDTSAVRARLTTSLPSSKFSSPLSSSKSLSSITSSGTVASRRIVRSESRNSGVSRINF